MGSDIMENMKVNQQMKATIITPTFNRPGVLKEAVDSVIDQTYHNFEHLIVADGHDPRVKLLIKNYKDDRIKYLFTLHLGYPGNLQRNLALKFAKGDVVLFLDDDNIINRDYIEKMVECFDNNEVGYAICKIVYDGIGIIDPQLPFKLRCIDSLNFMARTDLIRQIGGWIPYNLYSADFTIIEKISGISKGKFIPEVLGTHRNVMKRNEKPVSIYSNPAFAGRNFNKLFSATKFVIRKITDRLGIILYSDKSIRININRLLYQILCKVWLK